MTYERREHGGGGRGDGAQGSRRSNQCDDVNVTPVLFAGDHIRKQIFTNEGRQIANCIQTKRANLRNAYDRLVRLRLDMIADPNDVNRLESGLGELERWATYQANRKTPPVDRFTKKFIIENCKRTKNVQELEGFYQLFQSVLAYLKRD